MAERYGNRLTFSLVYCMICSTMKDDSQKVKSLSQTKEISIFMINKLITGNTILSEKTFSPDEMKDCLENKMPMNRKICMGYVDKLTREVEKKTFNYNNPAPVIFDANGNLIDGQHRFAAHVKANTPFRCIVATISDPDVFQYLDCGRSRDLPTRISLDDALKHNKEKPTKESMDHIRKEVRVARLWYKKENGPGPASDREIEEFLLSKKVYIDKAIASQPNESTRKTGYQTAIAMFFEKKPKECQEFFEAVGGDGVTISTSSVGVMRNYLDGKCGKSSKQMRGHGLFTERDYEITVSMIHKFVSNEVVKNPSTKDGWDF